MKFFEKTRPEIFIHTAKFKRDKKSGKRVWQFMLIVTMGTEVLAKTCDVSIVKAWQYVMTRDAAAVDVLIATEIEGCGIQFFAAIDDADP